jgi:hypothetical protein
LPQAAATAAPSGCFCRPAAAAARPGDLRVPRSRRSDPIFIVPVAADATAVRYEAIFV